MPGPHIVSGNKKKGKMHRVVVRGLDAAIRKLKEKDQAVVVIHCQVMK